MQFLGHSKVKPSLNKYGGFQLQVCAIFVVNKLRGLSTGTYELMFSKQASEHACKS